MHNSTNNIPNQQQAKPTTYQTNNKRNQTAPLEEPREEMSASSAHKKCKQRNLFHINESSLTDVAAAAGDDGEHMLAVSADAVDYLTDQATVGSETDFSMDEDSSGDEEEQEELHPIKDNQMNAHEDVVEDGANRQMQPSLHVVSSDEESLAPIDKPITSTVVKRSHKHEDHHSTKPDRKRRRRSPHRMVPSLSSTNNKGSGQNEQEGPSEVSKQAGRQNGGIGKQTKYDFDLEIPSFISKERLEVWCQLLNERPEDMTDDSDATALWRSKVLAVSEFDDDNALPPCLPQQENVYRF